MSRKKEEVKITDKKDERKISVIGSKFKIIETKKESELEEEVEEEEEDTKFRRFETGSGNVKGANPPLDKVGNAPKEKDLETELFRSTEEKKEGAGGLQYVPETRTDYIRNTTETDSRRRDEQATSEGRREVRIRETALGQDPMRSRFSPVRTINWEGQQVPVENQRDKGEYVVTADNFSRDQIGANSENPDRKYRRRH